MSFEESMAAGRRGEDFLVGIFENAGINCWTNERKTELLFYDLKFNFDGFEYTIEVKNDLMHAKTGNLAIEWYNTRQNKPSGLSATQADIWAFILHKPFSAHLCRTSVLRQFIQSNKPFREISAGGDGNAALKLYKDSILLPIFTRADGLMPNELKNALREILK